MTDTVKLPALSREEFIAGYCKRSDVHWEYLRQHKAAIPCYCGEDACEGWQMTADLDTINKYVEATLIRQPDAGATNDVSDSWKRILYVCEKNGHELHEIGSEEEASEWYDMEKLIRAALSAPAGSRGWISVKAELPPVETHVWASGYNWLDESKGRWQMEVIFDGSDWRGLEYRANGEPKRFLCHEPTHWQPLPTAPEEK